MVSKGKSHTPAVWYEYSEGRGRLQPGAHPLGPPKERHKNTKWSWSPSLKRKRNFEASYVTVMTGTYMDELDKSNGRYLSSRKHHLAIPSSLRVILELQTLVKNYAAKMG